MGINIGKKSFMSNFLESNFFSHDIDEHCSGGAPQVAVATPVTTLIDERSIMQPPEMLTNLFENLPVKLLQQQHHQSPQPDLVKTLFAFKL
jgi:hypothetical protein